MASAVNNPRPRTIDDLVGEFNYLGTAYQHSNTQGQRDISGNWIFQDPSMAQIRQNLTEYAVLPLGDPDVRLRVHKFAEANDCKLPKTLLLYVCMHVAMVACTQ